MSIRACPHETNQQRYDRKNQSHDQQIRLTPNYILWKRGRRTPGRGEAKLDPEKSGDLSFCDENIKQGAYPVHQQNSSCIHIKQNRDQHGGNSFLKLYRTISYHNSSKKKEINILEEQCRVFCYGSHSLRTSQVSRRRIRTMVCLNNL